MTRPRSIRALRPARGEQPMRMNRDDHGDTSRTIPAQCQRIWPSQNIATRWSTTRPYAYLANNVHMIFSRFVAAGLVLASCGDTDLRGDPHQIGNRAHSHLAHHVAPVRLHRDLGD